MNKGDLPNEVAKALGTKKEAQEALSEELSSQVIDSTGSLSLQCRFNPLGVNHV